MTYTNTKYVTYTNTKGPYFFCLAAFLVAFISVNLCSDKENE